MIGRAMLRWPASLPSTAPTSSLVLSIRTYATPGRPKSVVGEPSRPVKRAVKRDAAKPADGVSPAERKLAASKRKAAAKRAPVVLTEEQKAAQQERLANARASMQARLDKKKAQAKARADKEKVVELKKLALDLPPRLIVSGYTSFTSEKLKAWGPLTDQDGQKVSLGSRMRDCASQWKTLEPAEVEHYNHLARVKAEEGEAAYKSAVESHTPEEIRTANAARKELNRKFPKARGVKYPEIKDERLVTRPRNAFIQFITTRVTSADFNNMLVKDRLKLLGQEWKSLSADEKAKYAELAKQDVARYSEEYKDTYGHDMPSSKVTPRRSRAAAAAA